MIHSSPTAGFRLVPVARNGTLSDLAPPLPEEAVPMVAATREFYASVGYAPPWIGYLSVHGHVVVGGGAFVGAPKDGAVEIAYFTLRAWEGRGHASRTAQALVATARAQDPRLLVWAKTLPEPGASTRVLERLGFHRTGIVTDHEVGDAWRWELPP